MPKTSPIRFFAVTLSLLCSLSVGAQSPSNSSATLEARRKALDALLAEQWEYKMRTSPLYASILGDKRWNDKIDEFSQEAIDKRPCRNAEVPHAFRSYRYYRFS
jgi:hypothetical protein